MLDGSQNSTKVTEVIQNLLVSGGSREDLFASGEHFADLTDRIPLVDVLGEEFEAVP